MAPAVYRAALCLGALCIVGRVAPVWRISRYAAEMGDPDAPSLVGTLAVSFLTFVPGLLGVTWVLVQFVSGKFAAAIDRGRFVPAELVRGPLPIGDSLTGGPQEIGTALGVLFRLFGFPTVLAEFKFALDGTGYPKRANLLYEDEELLKDAEGRTFALVDPEAPRRLSWLCRRAAETAASTQTP